MIKTLNNTIKQDRTAYKIPRSVQDVIPIQRIFVDGIFQFGTKYSRTLRFSDINYAIASKEDKTAMFLGYSPLNQTYCMCLPQRLPHQRCCHRKLCPQSSKYRQLVLYLLQPIFHFSQPYHRNLPFQRITPPAFLLSVPDLRLERSLKYS